MNSTALAPAYVQMSALDASTWVFLTCMGRVRRSQDLLRDVVVVIK